MVRITDTIIKNGYPHISAHYRNGVCTWPTYEEQNTYHRHNYIIIHKSSQSG